MKLGMEEVEGLENISAMLGKQHDYSGTLLKLLVGNANISIENKLVILNWFKEMHQNTRVIYCTIIYQKDKQVLKVAKPRRQELRCDHYLLVTKINHNDKRTRDK